MRTSDRLLQRLRGLVDMPEGTTLQRTHASASQRNAGAWSWSAWGPAGEPLNIGSQWSMAQLLAAAELVVTSEDWGHAHLNSVDRHIDPLK